MKKQFVSLQETLSYLQFINTDNEAFSGKNYTPPESTQDFKMKTILKKPYNQITIPTPFKQQTKFQIPGSPNSGIQEENLGRKTVNKNRAIKKIIDTSKQILQQAYKYEQPPPEGKKSYITQFNIYLKQYNRLGEQILAQEENRQQKLRQEIGDQETKLQNVYSFAVSQDFRDLIYISIFKDKINKTNIDIIMDTFKERLVVLKPNQLCLYESTDQNSSFRSIKLHQIENVDYFSQPYIFTAMTIIKDKSAGQQFLYFRFDSPQKQHKWDRALYCNYMTRKMKRKSKYFLYQFPEKQDDKQINQGRQHKIKKRDDIKSYDLDKKKIVKNIVHQKQGEKQGTRMGTAGMDTQRDLPTTQKRDGKMQRFNTQNPLNFLSPKKQSAPHVMMTSKNTEQKQYFQSNIKGAKRKDTIQEHPQSQEDVGGPEKPKDFLTNLLLSGKQNSVINAQSPSNRNNQRKQSEGDIRQSHHTFKNQNIININRVNSEVQIEDSQTNKQKPQQIINPFTKRKIEIKEKYQNGITVKKPKLFSDKPKIIYLGNDEIQYWDFDPSTMHKSEKKLILFKDLKSCKIKDKLPSIVFQLQTKTLQFMGNLVQLNEIIEWIQLQKKERQFALPTTSGIREGANNGAIKKQPQFIL